jgi:hypothetical protein
MSEYLTGLGLGIVLGILLLILVAAGWLSTNVRRLERKVDALLRHSGVNVMDVALAEARTLLAAGKKIQAIRAYREYTGCGLAEAKVESLRHPA